MSTMLRISEAASLAMHTMAFLAARGDEPASTKQVAEALGASAEHLAKVLQRLTKVGMVRSVRGRKGGFALGKRGAGLTLLEVYEAIEGPFVARTCLLRIPMCTGRECLLGRLVDTVNKQFVEALGGTSLARLADGGWRIAGENA